MNLKELSNPISTGGGGPKFETDIQACFLVLMLSSGICPIVGGHINKINLQAKVDGIETDDFVVYTEAAKILIQVKKDITFGDNKKFKEVLHAAWTDFNTDDFTKGLDKIVLAVQHLSKVDINSIQFILKQSRYTSSIEEFFLHIKTDGFCSNAKREKTNIIRSILEEVNELAISNESFYLFLQHFYLLSFDLGDNEGISSALIQSHISQYRENSSLIWAKVQTYTQEVNQNGGTITKESIPNEIKELFENKIIYEGNSLLLLPEKKIEISDFQNISLLAQLNLIGSWNSENENDRKMVEEMIGRNYRDIINDSKIFLSNSPTVLNIVNTTYQLKNRTQLWESLKNQIIDDDLNNLKKSALQILLDINPVFDIDKDKRFYSTLSGKYSNSIKKNISITLALLNVNNNLEHCSYNKSENIIYQILSKVFESRDWKVWAELTQTGCFSILCEASPELFLKNIEDILENECVLFKKLFKESSNDFITGNDYFIDITWALQKLAWDEKYLLRVCFIFLKIQNLNSTSDRYLKQITEILLSWKPQTMANISQRKNIIDQLCDKDISFGWEISLILSTTSQQSTSGTLKPKYLKIIPENWKDEISQADFFNQASFCIKKLVQLSSLDYVKIIGLIDIFYKFPEESLNNFLDILSSRYVSELDSDQKYKIWNALNLFYKKHTKYSDSTWAAKKEIVERVETILKSLEPNDIFQLYRPFFSKSSTYGIYSADIDKFNKEREGYIVDILNTKGIEKLIKFSEVVDETHTIGYLLAKIDFSEEFKVVETLFLNGNDSNQVFIKSFLYSKYKETNGDFIKELIKFKKWTTEEITEILTSLPFENSVWGLVDKYLGNKKKLYWENIHIPYFHDKNIDVAITELLKVDRPFSLLACLDNSEKVVSTDLLTTIFLQTLKTKEKGDFKDQNFRYHLKKLINIIQSDSTVSRSDLFKIEWNYYLLLDKSIEIERALSEDPTLYGEYISILFKSKNEDFKKIEVGDGVPDQVYKILSKWSRVPGIQDNGIFNPSLFNGWMEKMKNIAEKTGHLEIALHKIGKILFHSPVDPSGLWINKIVAEELNKKENKTMREAFYVAIQNSRGVFTPTGGKEELSLSNEYEEKAKELEKNGFINLAITLREVSNSYRRDEDRAKNKKI